MKKERQKIELDKEKKDFKVLILINRKFFFYIRITLYPTAVLTLLLIPTS